MEASYINRHDRCGERSGDLSQIAVEYYRTTLHQAMDGSWLEIVFLWRLMLRVAVLDSFAGTCRG